MYVVSALRSSFGSMKNKRKGERGVEMVNASYESVDTIDTAVFSAFTFSCLCVKLLSLSVWVCMCMGGSNW